MLFVCLSVAAAQAQTSLSGQVTDQLGGAVPGATVTVTAQGSAAKTVQTGPDGRFTVAGVPPGANVVAVDASGFQRWTRTVEVGSSPATVDVVLPIPGVSESVAVTAPRLEEELPQEIERTGVRVQTITSAQIENGGFYDVAQVLQSLVPGMFLTPKAGPFDYVDVSLQGSRTNEILWLVDGVRISNRLYNGTTPLDTIPASMIERVEVIEGGQGLFYGTQAVAGAVNVVTKSFADAAGGRVQGGFDTNRGGHINLFGRRAAGAHRFVGFASKDEAKGYRSFPETQYQASTTDRNRSYDVLSIGGKYAYDFTKAARFSAMVQRNDVQLDNLRPGRSGATHVGGLSAGYNERAEHIFSAKLDYDPRPDAHLFFKSYYHQWDSHFTERRNVASAPGTVQVSSDAAFWGFKDVGANVLARLTPHKGFEYFAGYDFQNYRGRDDVLLIAPNAETVHAMFGQIRTTRELFDRATFALGTRVNAPSNSKSATVWNASSQYDFDKGVFARGTVGTSFRYPDAYELFAVDPDCCFGNPNLEPERSTNLNVSVGRRASTGSASYSVEGIFFYRRVTNLIVDVDGGPNGATITANQPDVVRVRGFSLVGSSTLSPAVNASLSYTYNSSERTNTLAGGYTTLTGIPSNQIDASLDVHPVRKPFGVTLTAIGVGRVTDRVATFGAVPRDQYLVVDLAGRYFLDSHRRHRINLRLENLFDEVYATRQGRNFVDGAPTPFLVRYLGVPRTFHLSYSLGF